MTLEKNSNQSDQIPNASEGFGMVPNDAESFGRIPNASESFRTFPKGSERKENHTLTVREVARMFEAAGVARTERSITNWCQPNKSGIARLDAYFDPNERRFYITPQSVELAITEEKAKVIKDGHSEPVGSVPQGSEETHKREIPAAEDNGKIKALEQEIMDLKITNKGKDYFIGLLQKERDGFQQERAEYVEKLVNARRMVGELEVKLLRLASPEGGVEELPG